MRPRIGLVRLTAVAARGAFALLLAPAVGRAQAAAPLPFSVGEQLTFTARVVKVGTIGTARMWVEGPADVRGCSTYVLRFVTRARVGLVKITDETTSWFDPRRMASLRFKKHERHPLSSHDELVDMYPDERRWRAATGEEGESPTDAPLDELSFMYVLRTLPLTPDTVYRFERHFDVARNPTTVRVIKREILTTPAGEFPTVLLEMRVKDPRRYRGDGVIRISLSDDAARLPVRIESAMPVAGKAVLTLKSYTRAPESAVPPAF